MSSGLITFVFLAFAPIFYLVQFEWQYQTNARSIKDLLVLVAVTAATNILFFIYVVLEPDPLPAVYDLLIFAIGGLFVDLVTKTYPSTGALCHLVCLLFFLSIDGLPMQYLGPGVAIVTMAVVGFGTTYKNSNYIRPPEAKNGTLIDALW